MATSIVWPEASNFEGASKLYWLESVSRLENVGTRPTDLTRQTPDGLFASGHPRREWTSSTLQLSPTVFLSSFPNKKLPFAQDW